MPWRLCKPMDEKLKFVARLLEGEKMAPLCREFGISRVTGYKIFERYKELGYEGLYERSRRPYRHANRLPVQIEKTILRVKKEYPTWGAQKIRDKLIQEYPVFKPPAKSTIHAVLDRHGLVKRRKRRRHARPQGTALSNVRESNALWCVDYKGEFRMGNQQYCYPLTITDFHTRYLLACEALDCTKVNKAIPVFEQVFKEFGVPKAIRSDNGVPFAAPNAFFNLSTLSVWWLRLGIEIERIKPGNPQQNGRHERMHLTLKDETTKPAEFNLLQQQERFDRFLTVYNDERPHQALGGRYPGQLYTPSAKAYEVPGELEYPFHDRTVRVTRCGRLSIGRRKISLSKVFAGQMVGLREVADDMWLVSFMDYDLGYFDNEEDRVEPTTPFKPIPEDMIKL